MQCALRAKLGDFAFFVQSKNLVVKHKRVVEVTTRFAKGFVALAGVFLFLLDFDDFTTLVEPTVGADGVRKAHGAAVRAGSQVAGLQSVVRAAHIAAAL